MGRMKNLVVETYKELPGGGARVLLIHYKDIINRPKTVAQLNATTVGYTPAVGDKVRLGEAFDYRVITPAAGQTPAVTAKFVSYEINIDSGHLSYDSIGDRGFEAFKNMLKSQIIGAGGDAQREFAETLNDDPRCIALFELRDSEDYAVLGSTIVPVTVKIKGDLGKSAGDANAVEIDIEDSSGFIFRTYPKTLALSIEA